MIKRYSRALLALLFLVFGFFSTTQAADNYPDRKVVSLIVPYPAAGPGRPQRGFLMGPPGSPWDKRGLEKIPGAAPAQLRVIRYCGCQPTGARPFIGLPQTRHRLPF